MIKKFGNDLDPAVGKCLDGNAELTSLSDAYNLTDADSSAVEKRVIAYVTLHYLTVHKWLGDMDSNWHAAKYYQVGWSAGEHGHTVLGFSEPAMKIIRKAQHLRRAAEDLVEMIMSI